MNTATSGKQLHRRWWIFLGLGLIVTACLGAVLAASLVPRLFPGLTFLYSGRLPLDNSQAKSSGPSRTLPEMLDVAQKAAIHIDKDAVLHNIDATTVGRTAGVPYSGPITGSLEISFYYDKPDGNTITVRLEDGDPGSTVRTSTSTYYSDSDPEGQERYRGTQSKWPSYEKLLGSYALTPRDAVASTWDDVQDYARQNGLMPEHVSPLIYTCCTDNGTPKWQIDYWYKPPRNSISLGDIFDVRGEVAYYMVDGIIGKILKTEYQPIEATPIPAP